MILAAFSHEKQSQFQLAPKLAMRGLKKQSQSLKGQESINSFIRKDYGK